MLVFLPIKQIETLTDNYLHTDTRFQMKARNGMTREAFLNYVILTSFINENNLPMGRDKQEAYTEASLKEAAQKCAGFYHREPEALTKDYIRCNGLEFFDPAEKERIQSGWKELK